MTKAEFRSIIADENRAFGKNIKIGDINFNAGVIYNPKYNNGRGSQYVGPDADKKLIDYQWRKAKEAGSFSVGDKEYSL